MRCVPAGVEPLLGRARLHLPSVEYASKRAALRLRIDVHHLSELLTALDAKAVVPE